ncbi:MAG TPA: hypothetical protein VMT44_07385 [Methanoregula sp.]|nr:hypothetical protein [Methanoregula sp.]
MVQRRISDTLFFFCLLFLAAGVSAAPLASQSAAAGNSTMPAQGSAASYTTRFFIPSEGSIHSAQINELINGPRGDVIFGTSFGLTTYNGTWNTLHIHRENFSEGLLDDYITAIEFDSRQNLWIGYPGGLQIFNGKTYLTVRDQQLLKDPRVTVLKRWDDAMWIATGNAGVHRYRDGNWSWFQPLTDNGPGFFTATGMVLDTASNALIISTYNEGEWIVRSQADPVRFERLSSGEDTFNPLSQVRRDPLGGAYFFNKTAVVHYSVSRGFETALTSADLSFAPLNINDLAAGPDGKLYIATDNGIFIWEDKSVYTHISSFEGIGPSPIVKSIFIDAENRVWFGTQDYVGYYQETASTGPLIPVELATTRQIPTTAPVTVTPEMTAPVSATISEEPGSPASAQDLVSSIIDPVVRAINAVLGKITGKAG